jgi:spore germination protein KB
MHVQEKVSSFQIGFLCFAFMSGFSTLYLNEAKVLMQDVWMANAAAAIVSLFVLGSAVFIQRRFGSLNLSDIIELLLGKWLGKLVLVFLMVKMLDLAVMSLRSISLFYKSAILPRTSPSIIILCVVIVTTYAVFLGLGPIARSVLVLLPFFAVMFLVICFFILGDIDANPLLPQFQSRAPLVLYETLSSFGFPFGKIAVLMFLYSEVKNPKKIFVSCGFGVFASLLYLLISTYLSIGSLGSNLFRTASFPLFLAIQLVKFGEYLERVEITIIGIWTIFTLYEIIVVQFVFVNIMSKVFSLKDRRFFILPVGVLFFAVAMKSFTRPTELLFYDTNVLPFTAILPMLVFPLMLFALTWMRKRNPPAESPSVPEQQ